MKVRSLGTFITLMVTACSLSAAEYHVSANGSDSNPGSAEKPLQSISAAAALAQPGDVITVHEGVYRERINPPRGGTSDDKRIVYRAAPGEAVIIKGSEIVKGWVRAQNDTWQVSLPSSFFGDHNPCQIEIAGDWFKPKSGTNRVYHTGSVYLNGHWLTEAAGREQVMEIGGKATNANCCIFCTVFYPEKPGINYITVSGFRMEHAAPNWAPPTAEQVGLIGTHWSKGWVIENNMIRYAACSGVTLGKYGDEWDNLAESAEGYIGTINRALENGWSKQNIGHHIVRNNEIAYCEQAGIVGSMGAVFSTISGNTIYEINRREMLGGYEMAGIKIHGAVDVLISSNHIYRCAGSGGIWLDWMAQGARVTGNLLHDNKCDLFMEVNHGPYLIDHNLFLSDGKQSMRDWSQGGAYAHNLFTGSFQFKTEKRETPWFKPHSIQGMKLSDIQRKDLQFYNNLFVKQQDLSAYTESGNLLIEAVSLEHDDPAGEDRLTLSRPSTDSSAKNRSIVTTGLLGNAAIPGAPFEQPDGAPYRLDTDYFGKKRTANPSPGHFSISYERNISFNVWPLKPLYNE